MGVTEAHAAEDAAPQPDGDRKRQRDVCVEQWAIVDGGSDPFQAPELRPIRLTGTCYNHPHLPDGELTSSNLQLLDERQGTARSLNTQFTLGTPSPEFLEWMKRKNITRPYRYYSAAAEELSLSLHSEEDRQSAEEMRKSVHVAAPRRVELSDIKEDADELQQETAGDGMDSAQRWLTADDWDELHPGCPMSWMSEKQSDAWMRRVLQRKAERKAEHREARDDRAEA